MRDGQPENKWSLYTTTDDRAKASLISESLRAQRRRCELWTVAEMHHRQHPLAPHTADRYAILVESR